MLNTFKDVLFTDTFAVLFVLSMLCLYIGTYLEYLFKIWDWGPECHSCKEKTFWTDTKIHCSECDDHRCNDIWSEGHAYGERGEYI